jgi:hypothetical protein
MAEVTAIRNNALPYPVYGVPWTIVFPLLDADGDPVTGATCDSEVSKNGDTGADCTNEGVEIPYTTATNKGMYYLILTAAEMTADIVTVTIYSATSKATCIVLYPRKLVSLLAGTSAGGDTGYITLPAAGGANDDIWNGCLCVATIDTNIEARIISDYTGSNKRAAVTPAWNVAPDADDTFVIYLPEGMQLPTANLTAILGSILTETTAGYLTAAFKKFFNIATPVLTVESVNQGADNNVILADANYGNAALHTHVAAIPTVTPDAAGVVATFLGVAGANMTAIGTDAAAKVLVTPAQKLVTDASGYAAADVKLVKTVDADTAITSRVDASTLAGKFAGITLIAKWLRGLYRKDAMDGTAKGEVNTGGGTFDEATDSNEGLRDTPPMGSAMVAAAPAMITGQQVRDAMKLAPTGGADGAGSVDAHLDAIPTVTPDAAGVAAGLIGALNDLSSGDVQTAAEAAIDAKVADDTIPADGDIPAAGGDATLANQAVLLGRLTAPRAVLLDNLVDLDAPVSGTGGIAGPGSDKCTLTINLNDGTPVADADVWITATAVPSPAMAGTKQTASDGTVWFMLDAGTTYYCWAQKDGVNFDNPRSFIASPDP